MNWDFGVELGNSRSPSGVMYLRSGFGKEGGLYPINVAMFITLTNRRNQPVMIKNYLVQMETDGGEFIDLDEVSVSGTTVYAGMFPNNLSAIQQTETFFENAVKGEIKPYGMVRGWLYFQFPKEGKFHDIVKLTISDFSGEPPFTTPALTSKAEKPAQPPNMYLDTPVDLSHLPIKFVDEDKR